VVKKCDYIVQKLGMDRRRDMYYKKSRDLLYHKEKEGKNTAQCEHFFSDDDYEFF